MPDEKAPSTMSTAELKQKIRNIYQLKRALWDNISKCKETLNIADSLLDCYEKELRGRERL